MRRLGWAPLFAAATMLSGCSTLFLQTDDFAERSGKGCKSEASCALFLIEAQARIDKCQENTVSYIRCVDARADAEVVRGRLQHFAVVRARAEHHASERLEAERQERADEAREVAAEARASKEAERRERAAASARIEALGVALISWQLNAAAGCRRTWIEVCENAPDHADAKDIGACLSGCRDAITASRVAELGRAEDACVQLFTPGSRPKCDVAEPEGAPRISPADKALCASECAARGKETARRAQAVAAEDRRSASPPPAPAAPSGHVKCCDGTLSPTCVTVHRGCCSHHGGVCG